MKVKKLFSDSGTPNYYVVQLCDGSFARFLVVPFRKITESDLVKVPHYMDIGKRGEEAEEYIYKLYGLEK